MPHTALKRHREYLSTYNFYSNSIVFRIQSSKGLEKWKNVQSFQLNQLVHGKYSFPHSRRELLLLKYDMWSRWLYEIENYSIECNGREGTTVVSEKDIEIIVGLAEKTRDTYSQVILEEYKDNFDQEFSKIWLETHDLAFRAFIKNISQLEGTFIEVFMMIVDQLCTVMQYTLMEIHELNNLIDIRDGIIDDIPFINATMFCVNYHILTARCLVQDRISIYKKYFDISRIYFKNYTKQPLSDELIDRVECLGVEIDFRRCATS